MFLRGPTRQPRGPPKRLQTRKFSDVAAGSPEVKPTLTALPEEGVSETPVTVARSGRMHKMGRRRGRSRVG
jgi:hypothetical protein